MHLVCRFSSLHGSHDHFNRNNSDIFSTYHFESLENFKVMNKVTILDEIYGKVLFIPFITEDEYPSLLEYKDIPVAVGHLELKGFQLTGTSSILEHGPDASQIFKKQKHVLSGHFHCRSTKGNVTYVGSPFAMDFSDANDTERGMATYDFTKNELKFIDWSDGPQFQHLKLSDVLEDPTIIKENARVKVDVDSDITYDESLQLRESLQTQFNLRDVTLEEKMEVNVDLTDIEQEVEDLKLETTSQVIEALLSRINDDAIDTDVLLQLIS